MDTVNDLILAEGEGQASSAFKHILRHFDTNLLSKIELNADGLNQLLPNRADFAFLAQERLEELNLQTLYYEEIIYKKKLIPTREDNWHDFFNGLIWCLMPKTKALLNSLHIRQIKQIGLKPRGKIRDRITHFDECGIVLFCFGSDIKADIQSHAWKGLFIDKKNEWHQSIHPFIFGHANLEMMLSPFIGLTAKALIIELERPFDRYSMSELDQVLSEEIETQQIFEKARVLLPLPLLGVPDWHFERQTNDFYSNQNYFMPKRVISAVKAHSARCVFKLYK